MSADGSFTYDPATSAGLRAIPRGQTATDTFTYRVSDGHGGAATATVTVTVRGAINHPPVANPDSFTTSNNATLNQNAASGVLANDTDLDGDTLSVDNVNGVGGTAPFTATTAQGATVTLQSDGSFSYDPTGSAVLQALSHAQTASDTFTYRGQRRTWRDRDGHRDDHRDRRESSAGRQPRCLHGRQQRGPGSGRRRRGPGQ